MWRTELASAEGCIPNLHRMKIKLKSSQRKRNEGWLQESGEWVTFLGGRRKPKSKSRKKKEESQQVIKERG